MLIFELNLLEKEKRGNVMELLKEEWKLRQEEFLAWERMQKKISPNTQMAYQLDLEEFYYFLKEYKIVSLEQVTETTVNTWLLKLERKGKQPATINRKLAALRSFFLYCLRKGYLKTDPMLQIPPIKFTRKEPLELSEDEIVQLFCVIPTDTKKGQRDFLLLYLLMETGIPLEQLLKLNKNAVDQTYGFMRLSLEKGEQIRPLPKQLCPCLFYYLEKKTGEEALFCARGAVPMTRQAFWKRIRQYIVTAKITKEITLPGLRGRKVPRLVNELKFLQQSHQSDALILPSPDRHL